MDPYFGRHDIPRLINMRVELLNLSNISLNKKLGTVLSWNAEHERFVVQLDCDGSLYSVKPMNLLCIGPILKYTIEKQLYSDIVSKSLDFENGMKLFDILTSLDSEEEYSHTFLKVMWLKQLINFIFKDTRNLNSIYEALEDIIKNSKFEDLVVLAKFKLIEILTLNKKLPEDPQIVALAMEVCNGNHYGLLPMFFTFLVLNFDLKTEVQNGNVELLQMLKDLYFRGKQMILNKTCSIHSNKCFVGGSIEFLNKWKQSKPSDSTIIEVEVEEVREKLESLIGSTGDKILHLSLAETYFSQRKFKKAIEKIEIYQENITKTHGHAAWFLRNCYLLKMQCYALLGNKYLAKKCLKQMKRVAKPFDTEEFFIGWENWIENAPRSTQKKKGKKRCVKTRTQCSSYECQKVEAQPGTFKFCARCLIAYYCSKKCQTKHWYAGHKHECREN